MNHMTSFCMIVLLTLSTLSANAGDFQIRFQQFLEQNIEIASAAFNSSAQEYGGAGDEYYLRRFWLRIRPKVGFKLPGTGKIQLIPEVELLWDRPLPESWTGYKP